MPQHDGLCAVGAGRDHVHRYFTNLLDALLMRAPHIVPLSRQALTVLQQLKPLTGGGRFLFPNQSKADVVERQLAHAERNKVRAAYHRSEYLAERSKMMQTRIITEERDYGDAHV